MLNAHSSLVKACKCVCQNNPWHVKHSFNCRRVSQCYLEKILIDLRWFPHNTGELQFTMYILHRFWNLKQNTWFALSFEMLIEVPVIAMIYEKHHLTWPHLRTLEMFTLLLKFFFVLDFKRKINKNNLFWTIVTNIFSYISSSTESLRW